MLFKPKKKGLLLATARPMYKAGAPPVKGYTFIGANDVNPTVGGTTVVNYPVTMTGTSGTLIFQTISQLVGVSSVVYDPTGANVTLTQDFSANPGAFFYFYSGSVPSASGTKNIQVTYASSVTFSTLAGAGWLATSLVSGFVSAVGSPTPTVVAGNFVFGVTYSAGGSMTDGYVANSNQTPTGHRLSDTSLSGGSQNSATADFASPAPGLSTLSSFSNNGLINAVYN